MKIRVLLSILMLSSIFVNSFAQLTPEEKYDSMFHLITLGLEGDGLEVYSEIISQTKFAAVQEKATFFIGEYFLYTYFLKGEEANYLVKAKTYFEYYRKKFPEGDNISTVNERLLSINSFLGDRILYGSLLREYFAERGIVAKKIDFANELIHIKPPNPFLFFYESEDTEDGVEAAAKYFDDIIINNPEFEVYGLYYKIILNLSYFKTEFISDGLYEIPKSWGHDWNNTSLEVQDLKNNIFSNLLILDDKYPDHSLTLNLHLIIAKIFLEEEKAAADDDKGIKSSEAKEHLDYILKNDPDQAGLRYLLVKEFMLINKFKSK